jgi:poly(3-hydroxybutyrate) depolymerase
MPIGRASYPEAVMSNAVLSTFLVLSIATTASAQKVTKESLTSQGTARTYYLFVPDSAKEKPAPLLILLHGSGRDGKILIEHWQSLAKKEGIILAGPDAIVRQGWGPDDGPLFIRHVIEAVQTDYAVDRRAMYVFGHSAGAIFGISMGVLESEYFAAVAVHAGSVSPSVVPFIAKAPRKIPIAVWLGTNDPGFPVRQVRDSLELLKRQEFPVELTEIAGHTHNYYGRSSEINKAAWAFLQGKRLEKDPLYQDYVMRR